MTVREALLSEIDRVPDDVLRALLSILQMTNSASPERFVTTVEPTQKCYPLRGLPLVMSEDFDEPMTDLWDALGS